MRKILVQHYPEADTVFNNMLVCLSWRHQKELVKEVTDSKKSSKTVDINDDRNPEKSELCW